MRRSVHLRSVNLSRDNEHDVHAVAAHPPAPRPSREGGGFPEGVCTPLWASRPPLSVSRRTSQGARRSAVFLSLVLSAVLVLGCGADTSGGESIASGGKVTLRLGYL